MENQLEMQYNLNKNVELPNPEDENHIIFFKFKKKKGLYN